MSHDFGWFFTIFEEICMKFSIFSLICFIFWNLFNQNDCKVVRSQCSSRGLPTAVKSPPSCRLGRKWCILRWLRVHHSVRSTMPTLRTARRPTNTLKQTRCWKKITAGIREGKFSGIMCPRKGYDYHFCEQFFLLEGVKTHVFDKKRV